MTPEQVVVQAVEEKRSIYGAAKKLGVNVNTIKHWLNKAGFELVTNVELRKKGKTE
jgi:uncharacterized protein YjcR